MGAASFQLGVTVSQFHGICEVVRFGSAAAESKRVAPRNQTSSQFYRRNHRGRCAREIMKHGWLVERALWFFGTFCLLLRGIKLHFRCLLVRRCFGGLRAEFRPVPVNVSDSTNCVWVGRKTFEQCCDDLGKRDVVLRGPEAGVVVSIWGKGDSNVADAHADSSMMGCNFYCALNGGTHLQIGGP